MLYPVPSDTCKLQEQPPYELFVLPSFGDFEVHK